MKVDLKIDDRAFRRSLNAFAANSRKTGQEILRSQAKLFVQDVVKITPPNRGKANRKGGEATIRADIRKIMRASNAKDAVTDPADIHSSYRNKSTGRVRRELKNKIKVRNLAAFIKAEIEKVGILASGWNAAAARLGAKLPAWITRHGTGRGSIRILLGALSMRIVLANAVKFVGNVKGLTRRVQSALDRRSKAMDRQLENFAVKQAARKAGFEVS
jgi:hypothetical protein